MKIVLCVSVPLRGKGRERHKQYAKWLQEEATMFPSPCGEKVGKDSAYTVSELNRLSEVSVPLRGKGRERLWLYREGDGQVRKFPSPCGEKVGKDWRD